MRAIPAIRLESRYLLKFLIGLNLLFFAYQWIGLGLTGSESKSTVPCVVVLNQTHQNIPQNVPQTMPVNSQVLRSNPEQLRYEKEHAGKPMSESISNSKGDVPANESNKDNRWWTVEQRTGYTVMRNYIISERMREFQNGGLSEWRTNSSVTYTTQASYEFLKHSQELCRRFDGPVSIAVYAPGKEMHLAANLIYHLRECSHQCVKNNISWHMITDDNIKPPAFDATKSPDEMLIEARFNMIFDCSESFDTFYERMEKQIFSAPNSNDVKNVRSQQNLPYPINVLRNVARLSAPTHHVLASDIELYPSINIVSMFSDLWTREQAGQVSIVDPKKPHVYVLPIFEVESNVKAPETKKELAEMLKKGTAIFFHKWVCDSCQNFVNRDKWIMETVNETSLNIFRKTQRKRSYWEPLYIGTNQEPLYEERLSWNGKRDKMSQMLEMCLMDYELLILDNAFLVHAPGIKRIDPKDERKRYPFMKKNGVVYDSVVKQLFKKYKNTNNC